MNAGRRKFNPDPLTDKKIALPTSMWEAIDDARGDQTRTSWIKEAIASALYYDGKQPA